MVDNGIDITTPIGDIKLSQNDQQPQPEQESTANKVGWIILGTLITTIVGYVAIKTIEAVAGDKSKSSE